MTYSLISTAGATRPDRDSSGQQLEPAIAALSDGGAIVAWASQRDPNVANGYDLLSQRYDADGNAVGDPVIVYRGPDDESGVGVNAVGLADGGWALAFEDQEANDLRVQTYDTTGALVTDDVIDLPDRTIAGDRDVTVSVSDSGYGASTLVALDTGGFAVIWNAGYPGILAEYIGAGTVYAQVFDADGQALADPAPIAPWIDTGSYSYDRGNYVYDSAALADGQFVVVTRMGYTTEGNDSDHAGVGVQIFDETGTQVVSSFIANTTVDEHVGTPAVAALAGGDFVLIWNAGNDTYWRRFDAEGNALTDEMSLGRYYYTPNVVAAPDNGFLFTLRDGGGFTPAYSTLGLRFDIYGQQVDDLFTINASGDNGTNYYNTAPDFVTLGSGAILGVWQGHATDGNEHDVLVQTFMAEDVRCNCDREIVAAAAPMAIFGLGGEDTITGSAEGDHIEGGGGYDMIAGLAGNDTIDGGSENDTIDGGAGDDLITGGTENATSNVFQIAPGEGDDTITDFRLGQDRLELDFTEAEIAAWTVGLDADGNRRVAFDGGGSLTFEGLGRNAGPTGAVAIVGAARQGVQLTADVSAISDPDGLDYAQFSYQWLRDGSAIVGATGASYVLTQADVGAVVSVEVRYTDLFQTEEILSAETATQVENVNDPPEGAVSIGSYAEIGTALQADTSGLSDPDGLGSFSYQWNRGDLLLSREASYVPTVADYRSTLTLTVSYIDGQGTYESVVARSGVVQPSPGERTGTEGDDRREGGEGRDLISLLEGNDTALGHAGGDVLDGGEGNDYLFGEGFDAIYAPEVAATVYRLYQATLDRTPDVTGLSNWTERLFTGEQSLLQVADGFVRSPEFQITYGAVDNATFVTLLYLNVLDRGPDATGLNNWTQRLDDGMSRAEVVLGFSQSPEFVSETAADARAFTGSKSAVTWGDDVFRLYQATLDRAPDVQGFSNWSGRLVDGMQLSVVSASFVNSAEFQATYGALDNEGFVTLLYRNVLDREPDATGLANWTQRLDDGMSRADVVLGFSQSPEFVAGTAGDLKDWIRGLDHGTGTPAHDLLLPGSGDNIVAGGVFADEFRFAQGDGGSHVVLDLEAWDYVSLQGFGYADADAALAHMTQSGSDVLFADQGVEVTFFDTQLGEVGSDMILV